MHTRHLQHLYFFQNASGVKCPELSYPTSGFVLPGGRSFEATRSFRCRTGYTLSGSTERTCESNGEWSGSETSCTSKYRKWANLVFSNLLDQSDCISVVTTSAWVLLLSMSFFLPWKNDLELDGLKLTWNKTPGNTNHNWPELGTDVICCSMARQGNSYLSLGVSFSPSIGTRCC